jgi:hypothetical protein
MATGLRRGVLHTPWITPSAMIATGRCRDVVEIAYAGDDAATRRGVLHTPVGATEGASVETCGLTALCSVQGRLLSATCSGTGRAFQQHEGRMQ